jgi:hypothetical protein
MILLAEVETVAPALIAAVVHTIVLLEQPQHQ